MVGDTRRGPSGRPADASEPGPPRIEPEINLDQEQAQLLAKTLITPSSEPMNLFRVLVRHPELMKRVNALGGLFMAHGSLPGREREIVILRVAWNSGCAYEFAQHAPIARRIGLSAQEIRDLGRPVEVGAWDNRDEALLRLTDEIMARLEVTNETWDVASRSHNEEQMMELVILTGFYQMLAAFLKTTRVPLDGGSLGFPEI